MLDSLRTHLAESVEELTRNQVTAATDFATYLREAEAELD